MAIVTIRTGAPGRPAAARRWSAIVPRRIPPPATMPLRAPLHRSLVALILLPAMLVGCADMSKDDCLKADWRELGRQDALKGQLAAERFGQRSAACRKNEIAADRDAYEAGHAQGRVAYCTADRGKGDALGGQPPAAVCAGPGGAGYARGHADGLQQFCTPRSGFDFGRFGAVDRNLCPEELATGFRIGYRLGREIFTLNQRLEDIRRQVADERKLLADPKTTPDRRDAANRRLGQLDADESSVRSMLRQAEQSGLALSNPAPAPGTATVTAAGAAQWLPGRWQLASVRFASAVDMNGDGVKSVDAMAEYDRCRRDQQLDLDADHRARLSTGASTSNCTPRTKAYQWSAVPARLRERSIVTLQLKGGMDPVTMVIEKVDATTLVARTELYDGTDSTSEAVVTYTRRR